jgi:hypothetical protein
MAPRSKDLESRDESSSQWDRVGLEDLPHPATALIYQFLNAQDRTTVAQLASVSDWARDLVLREARSWRFKVHSKPPKHLMRFLHRVCTASEAGRLTLTLEAHGFVSNSKRLVLSDVLASAMQQGRWPSVKELTLQVADHLSAAGQSELAVLLDNH